MNYVEAVLQVDLLVHGPEFSRIGVIDPARSRRLDKPEGAQQEYGLLIHLLRIILATSPASSGVTGCLRYWARATVHSGDLSCTCIRASSTGFRSRPLKFGDLADKVSVLPWLDAAALLAADHISRAGVPVFPSGLP